MLRHHAPTIAASIAHCGRIEAAALDYPIILNLNGNGELMDGGHREAAG